MVTPSAGSIVTVHFPFSDLTHSKLRPAVVLADAGRGDWVLCQITSKPFADLRAVEISDEDFARGSLKRLSYARPTKIFTAHNSLMHSVVGVLQDTSFRKIGDSVIQFLQSNLPAQPS